MMRSYHITEMCLLTFRHMLPRGIVAATIGNLDCDGAGNLSVVSGHKCLPFVGN